MKLKEIELIIFIGVIIFASGCKSGDKGNKHLLLFEDSGTEVWQDKWMLDGTRSKVINTEDGMELIAGTEYGNDTCHTVLWTKQSFKGNISIEYDYTRTDTATRSVNILYFHASGRGDAEFPSDISEWNHKRIVPRMRTYFNNLHTYHISYAAFGAKESSGDKDYIRLRRYNPERSGLVGTDVFGDHFDTGLFKTDVTYHIEVMKLKNEISMHIRNKSDVTDEMLCRWDVSKFPVCNRGRIGLRHMFARNARYNNFKVWQLD